MREKIAGAIETADCHSLGFVDRATYAILNILSEYGEEAVRAVSGVRQWVRDDFDYHEEPIGEETARAAIKAFLGTLS